MNYLLKWKFIGQDFPGKIDKLIFIQDNANGKAEKPFPGFIAKKVEMPKTIFALFHSTFSQNLSSNTPASGWEDFVELKRFYVEQKKDFTTKSLVFWFFWTLIVHTRRLQLVTVEGQLIVPLILWFYANFASVTRVLSSSLTLHRTVATQLAKLPSRLLMCEFIRFLRSSIKEHEWFMSSSLTSEHSDIHRCLIKRTSRFTSKGTTSTTVIRRLRRQASRYHLNSVCGWSL